MLAGEDEYALDDKGRVALPARYRDYFRDGVVLARFKDKDQSVRVYHPHDWGVFEERNFEPLDDYGRDDDRRRRRDVYRNLGQVVPDGQGRVLLPSRFIDELGLRGKVKILGNFSHLEIWEPVTLAAVDAEAGGDAA